MDQRVARVIIHLFTTAFEILLTVTIYIQAPYFNCDDCDDHFSKQPYVTIIHNTTSAAASNRVN
jgi:hypothetical protein